MIELAVALFLLYAYYFIIVMYILGLAIFGFVWYKIAGRAMTWVCFNIHRIYLLRKAKKGRISYGDVYVTLYKSWNYR